MRKLAPLALTLCLLGCPGPKAEPPGGPPEGSQQSTSKGGAEVSKDEAAREEAPQKPAKDLLSLPVWAPARYAPALGMDCFDGLRVDVHPHTGSVTAFERDLALGEGAVRRVAHRDYERAGAFGRGWRAEFESRIEPLEGSFLIRRSHGDALFLPVPGAPDTFAAVYGEAELLHRDADGFRLVEATGRVLSYDPDGQLLAVAPGYAVERAPGSIALTSALGRIELVLSQEGRVALARSDQGQVRYVYDADDRLIRVEGSSERTYAYADGALVSVASSETRLASIEVSSDGHLASLSAPGRVQRYRFEAEDGVESVHMTAPEGAWTYRLSADAWDVETPWGAERITFDARGCIRTRSGASPARAARDPYRAPQGTLVQRRRDARGRMVAVEAAGATETFRYDGLGRPVEHVPADGRALRYDYDSSGRLASVRGASGRTALSYDADGRLTEVCTPAGRSWTFGHDARGELTSLGGPMGPVRLLRDRSGRLVGRRDATGRAILTERSPTGLPVEITAGATVQRLAVEDDGETVSLSSGEDTLTFARRSSGAEPSLDVSVDGTPRLRYTFTPDHEEVATDWGPLRREWDAQGDVGRLVTPGGAFAFARDEDGRVARITYPNGVSTSIRRDRLGREVLRSSEVLRLETRRDANHDVVERVRDGRRERFGRDAAGRLTTSDGVTTSYDPDGNRTRVVCDGVEATWTTDARGRLKKAGGSRFQHDAAGRLTARTHAGGVDRFAYDRFGRLTLAARAGKQAVRYGYDPQGRLSSRTVGGATTRYLYDGDRLLAEVGPGRERFFAFGPGLDQPLAYWDVNENRWTYLHTDKLGTVLAYSNSAGERVAQVAFTPFGELRGEADEDLPVFFAGRLVDRESDLVPMRARWYDPALGAFLTPDPAGLRGGLNAYAYADGRPLEARDPLGLWPWSDDDEQQADSEPGLLSRIGGWVADKATRVKDTAVGAAEGLQYMTGIGVDDEIQDAALSASWRDITSGRAQSRALGAVDAYTKFVSFGLADPNTRRWAYDQEQAEVGQAYGEAGGWAFAIASGKDLPRLLGKGLLAGGRGAAALARGAWRAGNMPLGELAGNLGRLLGSSRGAAGRLFEALRSTPEALAKLGDLLSRNRNAIKQFFNRGTLQSVLNTTTRPFRNLARFLRHPIRNGFSFTHPFTQTLREAQVARAGLGQTLAEMAAATRATSPLASADDLARLAAAAGESLAGGTRAAGSADDLAAAAGALDDAAPARTVGDARGLRGALEGEEVGAVARPRANAPRAPPVTQRPPQGLDPAELKNFLPDHTGGVQDCGLRSVFGALNRSGRPTSWDEVVRAARELGLDVSETAGLNESQVAGLLQKLAGNVDDVLNFRPPRIKAAGLEALAHDLEPGQRAVVAVRRPPLPNGEEVPGHFFTAEKDADGVLRFFDYQTKAARTAEEILADPTITELGALWEPRPPPAAPVAAPVASARSLPASTPSARPVPTPRARPDVRPLPRSVRARSGVEVQLPPERLDHVLTGHTLEGFDPVRRLADLDRQHIVDPSHVTSLFKPGTVTNERELASLVRQALAGRAGTTVAEGAQRSLDLTLRGQRMRVVVGAGPGGQGTRLVTAFPTNGRSGLSLTRSEIEHLAAQVQSGNLTLDEVRASLAARAAR